MNKEKIPNVGMIHELPAFSLGKHIQPTWEGIGDGLDGRDSVSNHCSPQSDLIRSRL